MSQGTALLMALMKKIGFHVRFWTTLLSADSFELFQDLLRGFPEDERITRRDVIAAGQVYKAIWPLAKRTRQIDPAIRMLITDHICKEAQRPRDLGRYHDFFQYYWSELCDAIGVSTSTQYEHYWSGDKERSLIPDHNWGIWVPCPNGAVLHSVSTRVFGRRSNAVQCWHHRGQLVVRIQFPEPPTEALVFALSALRPHITVQATKRSGDFAVDCFIALVFPWNPAWDAFIAPIPHNVYHRCATPEFFQAVWGLLASKGITVGSLQQFCGATACSNVRDAHRAEFSLTD